MDEKIIQKIIQICDEKIAKKGENVGLSFYAFFANKNDNPKLLMEVAEWWIMKHKLDHFEKAIKIKKMCKQFLMIE
ncbi:MAG: hypothetical protein K2X95_10295 [Flavobacteriaceae bacterium]|nr:hypothetical protein [Flavobacteriaceae bacterium]